MVAPWVVSEGVGFASSSLPAPTGDHRMADRSMLRLRPSAVAPVTLGAPTVVRNSASKPFLFIVPRCWFADCNGDTAGGTEARPSLQSGTLRISAGVGRGLRARMSGNYI